MKRLVILTVLALAASLSFGQLSSGLFLQYDFNNGTASDMSGNGNDGTEFKTTLAADRFGNAGHAFHFDGDSSLVHMPDSALLSPYISISIWFKATAPGVLIGQQSGEIYTPQMNWMPLIYIHNDSTLFCGFWHGSLTNVSQSSGKWIDGQWHHVVLTADTVSGQTVYIDGAIAGTGNRIVYLPSMYKNQLGGGQTNLWPGTNNSVMIFPGDLDDLRVYHRVLSATEADSLFNDPNPFVVGIAEPQDHAVKVYPNPVRSSVNFSEISNVVLTDMTGKPLKQVSGTKSLDLTALPTGMYIVHFLDESGNSVSRQKIQKQ